MFDERYLRQKIKRLSESVWERRATDVEVSAWLNNFSAATPGGVEERLHMLFLLSNFLYFGVREIRELLRAQFQDLIFYPIISQVRQTRGDTTDLALIDRATEEAIFRTRFLAVGNPSESGQHLLYYFRQENRLPASLFINHVELPGLPAARAEHGVAYVDRYVFIDDLCGSGDQVISFSKDVLTRLKVEHPKASVGYYPLFATSKALERLRNESEFTDAACVMELDESFKCFSPISRIYDDPSLAPEKLTAETTARSYGDVLSPRHPLGYKDSQLAIGFSHNTPDNTLPIFWSDSIPALPNWNPIFPRHQKYG